MNIYLKAVIGLLITVSISVFSSVGNAEDKSSDKIKIGYVIDLTGNGAFLGTQTRRGAVLATEPDVSVLFEDIAGKVPNAVSAAMKLIENDHVDALICDLTAPCTALAQKVDSAEKVLIYHTPATSISAAHPQSFRNFIDYTEACRALARYWKDRGVEKIGSLNGNLEYGQRCFEGIEKVYPGHYSYRNNPGDDLRSAPLEFKKRGLEKIIFTGYENDFVSWIKFSRSQNVTIEPAFIEIMITASLWQQLGDIPLNGMVAGFKDVPPEFLERLRQNNEAPGDINASSIALGFNAVRSLSEALRKCPTKDLNCVKQQLATPKDGWLLGFRGWQSGVAEYPVVLKKLDGKTTTPLTP